jgi:hypothetical protein
VVDQEGFSHAPWAQEDNFPARCVRTDQFHERVQELARPCLVEASRQRRDLAPPWIFLPQRGFDLFRGNLNHVKINEVILNLVKKNKISRLALIKK